MSELRQIEVDELPTARCVEYGVYVQDGRTFVRVVNARYPYSDLISDEIYTHLKTLQGINDSLTTVSANIARLRDIGSGDCYSKEVGSLLDGAKELAKTQDALRRVWTYNDINESLASVAYLGLWAHVTKYDQQRSYGQSQRHDCVVKLGGFSLDRTDLLADIELITEHEGDPALLPVGYKAVGIAVPID